MPHGNFINTNVGKFIYIIYYFSFHKKVSVHCEPIVDGHAGIPAGCQGDKDNNLWVADMRLGVLKVSPDGAFKQVKDIYLGSVAQRADSLSSG